MSMMNELLLRKSKAPQGHWFHMWLRPRVVCTPLGQQPVYLHHQNRASRCCRGLLRQGGASTRVSMPGLTPTMHSENSGTTHPGGVEQPQHHQLLAVPQRGA